MQKSKLACAVAGAALIAGVWSASTATAAQYSDYRHQAMHRTHHWAGNHDLIVRKRAEREPVVVAPDPFHAGPATIITGPVAIAGTIVSLPFRLVETVFPPNANDPRVLVGAPVYAAGQIAELPFVAVNGAFGVQPAYYY